MKKLTILAALLLVCLLAACGTEQTPAQEQPPVQAETPVQTEKPEAPTEEKPAAQAQTPAAEEPAKEDSPVETADPMFRAAQALIDASVEELYDAVGYPIDVMYADSCLGEGEDGELYYEGFTVYTYRDAKDNETIYDVIEN